MGQGGAGVVGLVEGWLVLTRVRVGCAAPGGGGVSVAMLRIRNMGPADLPRPHQAPTSHGLPQCPTPRRDTKPARGPWRRGTPPPGVP